MKAEERAKMLVRLIQGRQESWDWHADNIASAIRSAENEALERAAVHVRDKEVKNPVVTINGQHFIPLTDGPKIIAEICANIRSLKHEEPSA